MDEILYCKICFKKCSGVDELKLHVESRHQNPQQADDDEQSTKRKNEIDKTPTKPVKKKKVAKSPRKKFTRNPENVVDYNRLEREFVECHVCQEICADESALRDHCKQHLLQEQNNVCGICAKTFRNMYALCEHFKLHKARIYACYICEEQFRTKESLSKHVCSRAVPCNVCNQVFRSKDELLKHFFVHKSLQGSYLNFTGV